ncbi:Piso0_003182 [Millerozyma farinosa CBS 7064]|uniref:Piso0_003182 protein n=1 Tax=Pichia sorbitophila (strain ATCC MYA-4447 / BCRC 22081 / CBS 7064 / NBRC 10061 / NRRL Y-12695) TaxID=559304 RepID=G8YHE7_PICSO|nr:Piso0_003182 [Millerozyma farinosa CBS 7064]CCE80849.1 Piso0_003182 [Millerozyma farinosa CBS 7064]
MDAKIKEITGVLKDPNRYNYLSLILEIQKELNDSSENDKLSYALNTLELFAFGDFKLFLKYEPQVLKLDSELLLKLINATIITIISNSEGQIIDIQEMMEEWKLNEALSRYAEAIQEAMPLNILLDNVIINLIENQLVDLSIDMVRGKLVVRRTRVIRDSFNPNWYTPRLLSPEDLQDCNIVNSLTYLKEWLNKNVDKTHSELANLMQKDDVQEPTNARKRKPSDISL